MLFNIVCAVLVTALGQSTDLKALKSELIKQHGPAQRTRIERGVDQVAALWRAEDGDLAAFAREQFIADPAQLDLALQRFETNLEQVDGHLLEIGREVRRPTELDLGPPLKIDELFAEWDPGGHVLDDLFERKLAFVVLLNWPLTSLEQRTRDGAKWSREQWAAARLVGRFDRRVPSSVSAAVAVAGAAADQYVATYNIWMHHLLDGRGQRLFPSGRRLLSHWNLRDELKSAYTSPDGLPRQRMIVQVMERIVSQTIPAAVIDNPRLDWNPSSNVVTPAPLDVVETDAPEKSAAADAAPELDVRYARLIAKFRAERLVDPYSPGAPTKIERAFVLGAEMPEARVKALLEEVLRSPLVPKVAAEIQRRLGRKLEPIDLWYSGFAPRSQPETELDAITRQRYPTAAAFERDLPRLLEGLEFDPARARFLAEHIRVDPARGSGHAMPAARRGDWPRLRTRVGRDGLNYQGFNIAIHELGHNVEQVFSLYNVDRTLLSGVPNSAITEALAMVLQSRDLELLGLSKRDAESERLRVLNDFWMTWEIAGVSLVDIAIWHWLYEHPDATPQALRDAALQIARATWNRYYAPVLGGKDSALLGIYSHLITYPLYLFNYTLGHLIAFQIEAQVQGGKKLGPEFERMASFGNVAPDLWMINATGQPISAAPLLRATEAALRRAR